MLSLPTDHLSAALFRAFARGDASASQLSAALFSELANHCSTCRAALEAFASAGRNRPGEGGQVLPFRVEANQAEGSVADFPELDGLSPQDRRETVRRSRKRYAGFGVARGFLCRARQSLPADAGSSRLWAELALAVLMNTKVNTREEFLESATLDVRAWGFIANAERVTGNLDEAERILGRLSDLVRATEVADLATLAELQSFAGSLRRAQRRWEESNSLLEVAASLYAVLGQREKQARTLLKAAINFYLAGDPWSMLAQLEPLYQLADTPRTRWEIRHNEILALVECGEAHSAALLLDESLPLYQQFPDAWTQSRLAAINGRVLHAHGVMEPAERNYRRARAGFLALGEPYTAAMISLDLAVLLLEANRFPEVAELALDMLATFQKVGVHREALAAWQLFVDAAHRQEASVVLAKRLGRFLENARQDPSLQFALE